MPSLYNFDPCPLGRYEDDGSSPSATTIGACDVDPIVAVGTDRGVVSFFDATAVAAGRAAEDVDTATVVGNGGGAPRTATGVADEPRVAAVTQLAWRPGERAVAVGRKDGQLSCWLLRVVGDDDRTSSSPASHPSPLAQFECAFADAEAHRANLSFLLWSSNGSRLFSGDEDGVCCVWKVDDDGTVLSLVRYQRRSALTAAVCFVVESDPINLLEDDSASAVFGTDNGELCLVNDSGACTTAQELSSRVDHVLFYEEKQMVVVVTRSLTLAQFRVHDDGDLLFVSNVKLSIPAGDKGEKLVREMTWVDTGIIGSATGENVLRFWDLNTQTNFILSLDSGGLDRSLQASSIAYSPQTKCLLAGTHAGEVAMWKRTCQNEHSSQPDSWESLMICHPQQHDCIQSIVCGSINGILAARTGHGAFVLREETLHQAYNEGVAAIQIGRNAIAVERTIGGPLIEIVTDISILGMVVDARHLVVWSGREVHVYRLFEEGYQLLSDIPSAAKVVSMYQDTLFLAEGRNLLVTNLSGVKRLSHYFSDDEGDPAFLHVTLNLIAVATDLGILKVMDVSKKEPVLMHQSKRLLNPESGEAIGVIRSAKCNAIGSKLSVISNDGEKDSLYVYDTRRGEVQHILLHGGRASPVSHFWDPAEPKLLSCEVKFAPSKTNDALKGEKDDQLQLFSTFFVAETGIHVQESFNLVNQSATLIGIDAPRHYFVESVGIKEWGKGVQTAMVLGRVMKHFNGIEDDDPLTIAAVMDYSYHLAIDDIDGAYRSIKAVRNPAIWENFAQVSLERRRLDLAQYCLSKMGHARGVAAVRLASSDPQEEVALAAVAIQLGLPEVAEELYLECNRFDLLGSLFRAEGRWEDALKVAKEHDRVHLDLTHLLYGRHLLHMGNAEQAKEHLGRSGMHKSTLLRELVQKKQLDVLENLLLESSDPEMCQWYANYCESNGELEKAKEYYTFLGNDLALVRLACHVDDIDTAADIVETSGNSAASYHLGRYLEGIDAIKDAIAFYSQSGVYNHAIRLAKVHGYDSELMALALKCQAPQMIGCARHFQNKGEVEKAVQLFLRGGDTTAALDLCLVALGKDETHKGSLVDVFMSLIESVGGTLPDEVADSSIQRLIQLGHYEKTLEFLCRIGRDVEKVLSVCIENNIELTDELAERLAAQVADDPERSFGLLAKACVEQGNFNLACKLYTKAGDRYRAMKSLLKTGQTDIIISYARASRNFDLYVLAGNYLQTLDWRRDPNLMKAILQFYTKSKSFEKLVNFFDSCAQSEINEHRDYEKAMAAWNEAKKHGARIAHDNGAEIIRGVERRLFLAGRYIQARDAMDTDPSAAESICLDLLGKEDLNIAVRTGDCLALLVEHNYSKRKFDAALEHIKAMQERQITPEEYIDEEILLAIVGKTIPVGDDDVDEIVEEVVG